LQLTIHSEDLAEGVIVDYISVHLQFGMKISQSLSYLWSMK